MIVSRRRLIGALATGAGGLLLSGCEILLCHAGWMGVVLEGFRMWM